MDAPSSKLFLLILIPCEEIKITITIAARYLVTPTIVQRRAKRILWNYFEVVEYAYGTVAHIERL